jgi:hypothetical protein
LIESLRNLVKLNTIYAALDEDDPELFLLTLRDGAEVRGRSRGWPNDKTELNREGPYSALQARQS